MGELTKVNGTLVPSGNTSAVNESTALELLRQFNDEKAMRFLPVVIYMIVLTVVGTLGNILVCCIYCSKLSKTCSHFFILTLAVLDLITCLIGMPTEIADLRFPYMFNAPAACKLLRFSESVTTIGSSVILIAVAFDRFFRICRLGKQISVHRAKIICIVAILLGVLTSWPACFLFGKKTIDLGIPGVLGVDCSTDDSVRGTIYPTIYYGFLFLLFGSCTVFFTVIYVRIGMEIWRRKRINIGQRVPQPVQTPEVVEDKKRTFSNSSTSDQPSDPISTDMSSDSHEEPGAHCKCLAEKRKVPAAPRPTPGPRQQMKVTRTTVVLFAVTVAYVVSFLPFLTGMVLRNVKKGFESSLSPEGEVAFKLCLKSYFINNAINPVIYSFLNVNFRRDVKIFLKRCFNTCCCSKNRDI